MSYIDRAQLIKAILNLHDCYNGFSDTYDKACIIGVIEEMPSADVEPIRHGRWINGKCSECGCDRVITKIYRGDEVIWTASYKDNYCPTCGVKMDKVEV